MAESYQLRQIKIFISSPSDVKEEREAALKEIERLEGFAHIRDWCSLKAYAYEREAPAAIGKSAQRTVDEYMLEADEADIFVCILWTRMGTPFTDEANDERFNSGTEYEFKKAYAANQKSSRPQILLYRSMKSSPPDLDIDQLKLVQEFFQRFHGETSEYKGLLTKFSSTEEFKEKLFRHLNDILSKHFLPSREPVTLPSSRRYDFYRHVNLPANYIERRDLITKVRDTILGSTSRCIALHAMGGAGKSVLARALCDDEKIQSAFTDGILWASLGKTPDITARMREWIGELGGTITENAPTLTSLKNNLAELLKDKACLLIVDDVWDDKHADPFRVDAVNCRLFMTTRDAETVRPLGAEIHPIPMLSQPEAVELLDAWGGDSVKQLESSRKDQVIARLGRHPLAIKLAGAQLQQKPLEEWFRDFDLGKLKLRRPDPDDPHTSLMATFNLSLEDLNEQDRKLYNSLAIFKEDEAIPESAIVRLWKGLENLGYLETSDLEPSDLLEDLGSRALLELIIRDGARFVGIHNLLRKYSKKELGSEGGRKAHEALLSAYRGSDSSVGWHTVPNDGYLYGHLSYHLKEIGNYEELRRLFAEQDWMNARVPADRWLYDGYLADLSMAWVMADRKVADDEEYLADCFRYGLIRTSINSLAGNYVPEVVVAAVESGISSWSSERALSVAEKMPSKKQACRLLTLLLGTDKLSSAQRARTPKLALDAALAVGDEWSRAEVLTAVAGQLSGEEKATVLRQALDAALAIDSDGWRAEALSAVAGQLVGEEKATVLRQALDAALDAALDIGDEGSRAKALTAVAGQLSGEEKATVLRQALDAALAIDNDGWRAEALSAVAGQLVGEEKATVLRQALDAALAVGDVRSRAYALTAVAGQLVGASNAPTLRHALDAALAIGDGGWRARALSAVAAQLVGEEKATVLRHALDAALAVGDEGWRARALSAVAAQLSGEENSPALRHALDAALAIGGEGSRAEALVSLSLHLDKATALLHTIDCLHWLESKKRSYYIHICSKLLTNLALQPQTYGSIASNLIEICKNWRWL